MVQTMTFDIMTSWNLLVAAYLLTNVPVVLSQPTCMIQYNGTCISPRNCVNCAIPLDSLDCSLRIGPLCLLPSKCTDCTGPPPTTDFTKCPCDRVCPIELQELKLCTAETCGCPDVQVPETVTVQEKEFREDMLPKHVVHENVLDLELLGGALFVLNTTNDIQLCADMGEKIEKDNLSQYVTTVKILVTECVTEAVWVDNGITMPGSNVEEINCDNYSKRH
ncbi:uncharacterized protein LOC142101487 [Mixophyes fleayi]|uniref:uncharacterized protein LOC142101487 n=1 Tax=Mixophyes fleayi TaxID=3061075 RepID=UPI003F4D78B5